jgi:hypothetical protein
MSRISSKLRKAVLKRDNKTCCKCGRQKPLELHHIKPVADGGPDEVSNLITLCSACHDEWELVEITTRINFNDWLSLPSLGSLLIVILKQEWPDNMSAREYKKQMLATLEMMKKDRKNLSWNQEEEDGSI